MDNTEDFFKNYRGRYSQYWIERWGLIPELPTSFDNANSMYELVSWLQRAFKNLLDDFQQLEAEFEDFKNAIIDLLEYLIPELIRRYHDSAEFRASFIILLEDILSGEERTWVKDLLKELIEIDMREWIEAYLKDLLTDLELQEFFEEVFKVLLNDLQNQVNTNKVSIATTNSRIDNLIFNAGDGTVPSELIDIRVENNGTVYDTAGDAVRNKVSYKEGTNLIDPAKAVTGFYVSSTVGAKNPDATYEYNTIQSIEGITYYLVPTSNIHIAFFNSSNGFISGLVDPKNFTTPSDTKYFTVSYKLTYANQVMLSKNPITTYEPFVKGIDGNEILKGTISGNKLLPDLKLKVETAVSYVEGVNKINKDIATTGYYVSGTAGAKNVNEIYQYNYINVNDGEQFYLYYASNVHIAFFDNTGTFISGLVSPSNPFTVPANTVKMSVSYQISQKDAIVLAKKEVSQYVPYELGIDGTKISSQTIQYNALSADLVEALKATKIIKVGPGQTYTSLLKAISENTATKNTYQLVNYKVDMKQEYIDKYGADFFTNYVDYSGSDFNKRGYNLKNGDNLVADASSGIYFTYDNANDNVCTYFSLLNMTMNNYVYGVDFKTTTGSCRYILHDDFAWGAEGKNMTENCRFEGESKYHQAVGGGTGFNSIYHHKNNKYVNCGADAVTYHINSQAGAKNKIIYENLWLSDGSSLRGTWYGQSTEVSEMIVFGCKADNIYIKAHSIDGTSPNVNLELTKWNNQTVIEIGD